MDQDLFVLLISKYLLESIVDQRVQVFLFHLVILLREQVVLIIPLFLTSIPNRLLIFLVLSIDPLLKHLLLYEVKVSSQFRVTPPLSGWFSDIPSRPLSHFQNPDFRKTLFQIEDTRFHFRFREADKVEIVASFQPLDHRGQQPAFRIVVIDDDLGLRHSAHFRI